MRVGTLEEVGGDALDALRADQPAEAVPALRDNDHAGVGHPGSSGAFEGLYKAEIEALLGLSRDELERLAPDTTPIEAYDQLLGVVKVASATNVSQAALRDRIVALGGVAVRIAGQVPTLATILR